MSAGYHIDYFFNYKDRISCFKIPPFGAGKIELFREEEEIFKSEEIQMVSIGEKEVVIFCGNLYQGNIYIKDKNGEKHKIYSTKEKIINIDNIDSFIYRLWSEVLSHLCIRADKFSNLKENIVIEIEKESVIDFAYNAQPEEDVKEKILSENPHISGYEMYYNIGSGFLKPLLDKNKNRIYTGMSQMMLAISDPFIDTDTINIPFDSIINKSHGHAFIEKHFNRLKYPNLDKLDIIQ